MGRKRLDGDGARRSDDLSRLPAGWGITRIIISNWVLLILGTLLVLFAGWMAFMEAGWAGSAPLQEGSRWEMILTLLMLGLVVIGLAVYSLKNMRIDRHRHEWRA